MPERATTAGSWIVLLSALAGGAVVHAAGPGVETGVRPGDDFFEYANGEWLAATEIPAGRPRWNARDEINERTRQQVAALIDDAARAPPGSDARKLGDFRAAWRDEAGIEARGITALAAPFERIDRVRDTVSLARLLGAGMRADVDPLNYGVYDSAHVLGLAVEPGSHGEKNSVAFLLQGGLGLPDREAYLGATPDLQALRADYRSYLARLLALAGFDRADARAAAVLELETALARSHATREASADERSGENLWARAEFPRRAPGMDWPAFFAAALLAHQDAFVVWQPGAVTGLAELVHTQPLEAWRDYLRARVIDQHADVLPRAFAEAALTFRARAAGGAPLAPRAQRADEAVRRALGGALGRMYAERHFSATQKARVETIVRNVIAAFRRRVAAVSWLSSPGKARALAKFDTLYFGVGYPEAWPNYSSLQVDAADAAGNLQRVAAWTYGDALARLGRPADRRQWWISPHESGAVLVFHQNAYNFAAALLQPPKYDATASDAASYGAIGAIVGHEVSHFFDTLGADYDADGSKNRWWSAADLAAYQEATAPLVQQFSNYRPFADLAIDGKLTLVENLADLAGLEAAFDAYRQTAGAAARDAQTRREQDRQFFLGFARAWRARYGDDALRRQVQSNDHAPERYRVATVRNLDAWYEAFDVRPGQRLFLEPAERVHVW